MAKVHEGALLMMDPDEARRLRVGNPRGREAEVLAAGFKALADPTRVGLGAALAAKKQLCVCDLSVIVGKPQNLTSHHLQILRNAGVVSSRRDGKMVMYSLTKLGRRLVAAGITSARGES